MSLSRLSRPDGVLARWLGRLQIDATLVAALLSRFWQAISGPITIALIIANLSVGQQGVYYGLVSIVALQGLFELGLLNLVVSQVGRQAGGLVDRFEKRGGIFRPPRVELAPHASADEIQDRRFRLRAIERGARRWFAAAACAFVAVGWAAGYRSLIGAAETIDWQAPLLVLVPLAAWTVWLSPTLSILEGLGLRESVYRLRLLQMIAGSILVWATLAAGGGLWALVVSAAVQAGFTAWMVRAHRPFLDWVLHGAASGFSEPAGTHSHGPSDRTSHAESFRAPSFSWVADVLPGQWRLALLSIAQHFATQFFALIVLFYHGERAAAPLGMLLSMTGPIQMLALTWLQTKLALISALHGRGDREAAGTMWRRTAVVSTAMLIVALIAVTVILGALTHQWPELRPRFLTTPQIMLLSLGCLATHLVALQGFYYISRFSRPIFKPALIGFIGLGALVWMGGRVGSVDGLLTGYAVGAAGVLLPLHTFAYAMLRR